MANRSLRWIRLKCNESRGVNKEGVPHEASAISNFGSGAGRPFPDCANRALSGAWRTRGRGRRPRRWGAGVPSAGGAAGAAVEATVARVEWEEGDVGVDTAGLRCRVVA